MYHEEKFINGVLSWRSQPMGMFTPYTAEQLSVMLISARQNGQALPLVGIPTCTAPITEIFSVKHRKTCPVSQPGFVADVTPGHPSACTCDFMPRLKEVLA